MLLVAGLGGRSALAVCRRWVPSPFSAAGNGALRGAKVLRWECDTPLAREMA
eukprot:CAMPEP_0197877102 /NCGR_PEP_ID=MMETSP1439-20131203/5914_1 /TAXON_ID=66791 /ORGANISM="Gonyaulax spinifera, Strain CCMP409" /LENGTH=51 /DNA_ID=CAMNT_0043496431 /DNA_START=40 /DNA_END=192 /DNA_ORIENTATION=+